MRQRTPATHPRLRVIDQDNAAPGLKVEPAELSVRAVLIKNGVIPADSLKDALAAAAPWFRLWREHRSWSTGVWVCVVASPGGGEYAGCRPHHLPFHTDMSRYVSPPRFTAIRCVRADTGQAGGGENRLIHIEDAIVRLEQLGRADILECLYRPRLLCNGNVGPMVCIVPRDEREGVVRVFDQKAATKGAHYQLNEQDELRLNEFVDLCGTWDDLFMSVALEAGDWLVFSNHRFLHGRTACTGYGRTTEVCLGNVER